MSTDQDQPEGEPVDEAPRPEAEAAKPAKKAVEDWATAKGMLPEVSQGGALGLPSAANVGGAVRVSLQHSSKVAPRHNPNSVAFKAARARYGWPIGYEMTEAEFDEAVAKAYGPNSEVVCR
jgi:hypothetical protein